MRHSRIAKLEEVEMPGPHDKRYGWKKIKRSKAGNAIRAVVSTQIFEFAQSA
jgi:hypothetical protein